MSIGSTIPWNRLQRWRAATFLVGGGAGLLSAALFGLELAEVGPWWELWSLAQTLEYLVPFVGLLGIYPELRTRSPRLARVGLAIAAVAIVLLVVNRVLLGLIGHDRPFVIVLLMVAAMISGFFVFGVAGLRANVPSQLVGILLIAVAAVTVVFFAVFVAPVHRAYPTAANAVVAVTLLSIGYLLLSIDARPPEVARRIDADGSR